MQALRTIVRAMGVATNGANVVLKFQSALVKHLPTIRAAFPGTPWVFLFRNPLEVMASLLYRDGADAAVSKRAPCLRSQPAPPPEVLHELGMKASQARMTPPAQYCAAHIAVLMRSGLSALNTSTVRCEQQSAPTTLMACLHRRHPHSPSSTPGCLKQ